MALENKNRAELVERALDGQSAEVKARVLAIIIRYNIDVRNEFFLIFVAIGHLLAIVEEAPENWRSLFDEFERKLDEWSEQNLKTLTAIQQQGKAAEIMSQSFLTLTKSMTVSISKTSELQSDLIKSSKTLAKLNTSLDNVRKDLETSLSTTSALSEKFEKTEEELTKMQNRVEWMWVTNSVLAAAIASFILLFSWVLWKQQTVTTEQNERLGELMQKAIREECLAGLVADDEPDCQQLF